MIDTLLERARHIPLVVLSFGNETVSLEELEQKMVQHGRATRAIEIPYARLAALSKGEKSGRDRELLVLGWAPALLQGVVARDRVDRRPVLVVPGEADLHLTGSESPAPLPFVHDRLEESHEAASEFLGPESRGTLRPVEAGVDEPEAVLGEGALDRDDVMPLSHASTMD